uniref:Secreted protein n=1 Tax=Setaria viridis TaxID=4556 RepID=A0A4U6V2H4_SETVI|nr:hypothetical protein SEVIR_4G277201v2 [Setaria viridis]
MIVEIIKSCALLLWRLTSLCAVSRRACAQGLVRVARQLATTARRGGSSVGPARGWRHRRQQRAHGRRR